MECEVVTRYMDGQLNLEKGVIDRMFEPLTSAQTVYYFYSSIQYPDIDEHEMLVGYFSRHIDSEYTKFLESIKDFDTWEDVKIFYAI